MEFPPDSGGMKTEAENVPKNKEIFMAKSARSTTIIGGADGPTSIFLVGGKEKNILKRIRTAFLNRKYKIKRKLAARSITPNPHTLEEVTAYLQQRYHAFEADESYRSYQERKRSMKMALIQRTRPELLDMEKQVDPPSDFNDMEAVKEWHRQLDNWISDCQQKTDAVSDEIFPTDYHLFIIQKESQGTLEVEMETLHSLLSVSWSGERKIMDAISKDIHRYYGVSQRDIDEKTDRYRSLLASLCS